jgi:energy-coupling factor transporter ATP-binding protein EcfA2
MKKEIELNNVQAITHLKFELPEGGGVVVLLGKNGCGKTTTLNAISEAAGGKKTGLSARDGAKFGTIEAPGVRLRVGKSTTKMGELEFDSIEGRVPLADLVDPGFKDPEACDRVRTKALIQLAGVEPNLEIFREIEGYSESANTISASPDDVLGMAAALKMEVEKLARSAEESATDALSRSKVLWEQSEGLDATIERDGEKLRDASEQAIRDLADIQRTALAREEQLKQWLDCKFHLDKMVDETKPISEIEHKITWWETRVRETQNEIELLKANLVEAQSNLKSWTQELRHAQQIEKAQKELRAVVDAGEPMLIENKEINRKFVAVESARHHEQAGEIQRKKHIDRAGAENFQRIATGHEGWGKQYRAGAARIDGILSEQINKLGVDLAVMDGRLYYDTSRGPTLYHELSDGERWRIALDIAIDLAGTNGLLSIPQASWEALDPANRIAIDEHCKRRGAVIVTAAAADGELRAELFAGA